MIVSIESFNGSHQGTILFPEYLITLITTTYTNTAAKVRVGEIIALNNTFSLRVGVKQGDILSCSIFKKIFISEIYLEKIIKKWVVL